MAAYPPFILRPFGLSAILWDGIGDNISISIGLLENLLTENLSMENYGKGVELISVNFIAVPPENKNHPEQLKYHPRGRELYAQLKLPFQQIRYASPQQIIKLMAQTYLKAIDQYADLTIPDFNLRQFKTDVIQLFDRAGWG
ncbi:MAG: hypothetical protein DHS20C18_25220 [Saprospiraceae bacterium]|nr:MAG: hypothetical protein DHS20C18_25220 [Saprospiraceae bacterium]